MMFNYLLVKGSLQISLSKKSQTNNYTKVCYDRSALVGMCNYFETVPLSVSIKPIFSLIFVPVVQCSPRVYRYAAYVFLIVYCVCQREREVD